MLNSYAFLGEIRGAINFWCTAKANKHPANVKPTIFKFEEENSKLVVKDLSVKTDKASEEKFKDFAKSLRKDAVIEESYYIINDIIGMNSSVAKKD